MSKTIAFISILAFVLSYQRCAFAECSIDSSLTVLKRESLHLDGNRKISVLVASFPDKKGARGEAMRLIILDDQCKLLLDRSYLDDRANFYIEDFLHNNEIQKIVHFITQDIGASDCLYNHFLFRIDYENDVINIIDVSPNNLGHLVQGGLYIGELADRRRWGAVLWDSTMDGERHYAPAHFVFRSFVWDGTRLLEAEPFTTSERYDAREVMEKLNLPYVVPKRPDNWGTC